MIFAFKVSQGIGIISIKHPSKVYKTLMWKVIRERRMDQEKWTLELVFPNTMYLLLQLVQCGSLIGTNIILFTKSFLWAEKNVLTPPVTGCMIMDKCHLYDFYLR